MSFESLKASGVIPKTIGTYTYKSLICPKIVRTKLPSTQNETREISIPYAKQEVEKKRQNNRGPSTRLQ